MHIISYGNPVVEFFRTTRKVLTEPKNFFQYEYERYSLSQVLSFALVTAWICAFFVFFWDTSSSIFLQKLSDNWLAEMQIEELGILEPKSLIQGILIEGAILTLYPFICLLWLYLAASVLLLFAKLFISEEESKSKVSHKSCLRLLAFAFVGSWFSIVPIFGALIAYVASLIFLVIGVREVFSVSTKRAILVALAPQIILFASMVFMLLLVISLSFFGITAAFLTSI